MREPLIIQGGMGIAISGWRLAKTVSMLGQLGVVSGTCIDSVFARLLEMGDPGGNMRKALDAFPDQEMAERVRKKYYRETPIKAGHKYISRPLPGARLNRAQQELMVIANFAEVYLAKLGHAGKIGINFLEKLQVTTLPSLYGAILAGVDYVIMGAGIPREIPGSLDKLAMHEDAKIGIDVIGADSTDNFSSEFSPKSFFSDFSDSLPEVFRPKFLAIISSNVLAITLKKKSNGRVDGFIVEKPLAGGHNAPPRGPLKLNEAGEPIYGERDVVNLTQLKKLELPFWLAGGHGSAEGLKFALEEGAQGIQAGTLFALCNESGLSQKYKKIALEKILTDKLNILTDARASPTGFPFKVAQIENTCSDDEVSKKRPRLCDLGYLRKAYKKENGFLGYRCASEPEDQYLEKGGVIEATIGRKCLCNALMVNVGLGQTQLNSHQELPLLTLGDDIQKVKRFISKESLSYSAKDIIDDLLTLVRRPVAQL